MAKLTSTTSSAGQLHRRVVKQATINRPERNTSEHEAPYVKVSGHPPRRLSAQHQDTMPDGHWLDESSRVACFDKIEIVLPRPPEELQTLLPLRQLQAHALISQLQHFSLYEYRAKLLIVAPDPEYWQILEG